MTLPLVFFLLYALQRILKILWFFFRGSGIHRKDLRYFKTGIFLLLIKDEADGTSCSAVTGVYFGEENQGWIFPEVLGFFVIKF